MYSNTFEDLFVEDRTAVDQRFYDIAAHDDMIRCFTGEQVTMHPETLRVQPLHQDFHRVRPESTTLKQLIFNTDTEEEPETWRNKAKMEWTESDVLHWIADVANKEHFPCEAVNASDLKVDGLTLLRFTREDFINRDPNYGVQLYNALHNVEPLDSEMMDTTGYTTLHSKQESPFVSDAGSNDQVAMEQNHLSDEKDTDSEPECKPVEKPAKRPPGRPPGTKTKDKTKKTGRLWEFIRDLLHNRQYCPSLICWEDHSDGVFRFKNSEKVAKIWGSRKGNDKMNYEKLSRAMRYYYKSKVLQPVLGRKLVYKFGPTARGWQSENPNFSQ